MQDVVRKRGPWSCIECVSYGGAPPFWAERPDQCRRGLGAQAVFRAEADFFTFCKGDLGNFLKTFQIYDFKGVGCREGRGSSTRPARWVRPLPLYNEGNPI